MRTVFLFLTSALCSFALVSCVQASRCEPSDVRFVASEQELDGNPSVVFYGFTFKDGNPVDLLKERGRLPLLMNTSKYGNESCGLVLTIQSDIPLTISEGYRIDTLYRDRTGGYNYVLYYNQRGIKPFQEYPFPVLSAAPERGASLVIPMTISFGYINNGPRINKKLFVLGFPDKCKATEKDLIRNRQAFLTAMASNFYPDPTDLAIVYKDTIVSPIKNIEIWKGKPSPQTRLVDLK